MRVTPGGPRRGGQALVAPLLVALFALCVSVAIDRSAPLPSADVSRGSEEAFVSRLEPREIEGGVVRRRWAREALTAEFANLPPGPLQIEVVLRGHRHEVAVSAGGLIVGTLAPGRYRGEYRAPESRDGRLGVHLRTETFDARGRALGFMLERLVVHHTKAAGFPRLPLVLLLLLPALATFLLARAASLPDSLALVLATASTLAQALVLWPEGILRSDYSTRLALLLASGASVAAFWSRRLSPEGTDGGAASRSGFAALLLVLWVQGVLATHPMIVTSDAVFHANKVRAASEGQYLPVSLTPHDPPFRFPYGVTFHLLLVPFYRAGFDPQATVVWSAALASVVASAALLRALPPEAGRASLAVVVLQLLPVTFGPWSAGNFSNIFAQALTVLFLAWDLKGRPGGWPLGAALVALGATAHLGGFLVLLVLGPVLVWAEARGGRGKPLILAVAVGLSVAAAYYLQLTGVMMAQLPRLSAGEGGPRDLLAAGLRQGQRLLHEWGWPALLAAALGAVVTRLRAPGTPPAIRGLWIATALLAVLALLSPLEVRYLYAAAPAAALLAADGLLWVRAQPRGVVVVAALLLAQVALAVRGFLYAMLEAYRP